MVQQSQQSNKFVFIPGHKVDNPNPAAGNIAMRRVEGANTSDEAKPLLRPGIKAGEPVQVYNAEPVEIPEPEQPLNAQEQLLLRKEIITQYDALRQQYIAEGEKARFDAQEWAQRLIETTENDIRMLFSKNAQDCAEKLKASGEQGYKEGYEKGFSEGSEKGYEEGYANALNKCKDTLQELMNLLRVIDEEREKYFKEYENKLFDTIFTIANKITVDSLKQKDKTVITKMLREAAKSFRNSEYVKVTLSKLDTEQIGTAGMDAMREIFRDTQHIEFEIVKDAPEGTLILDNGSEITDAGVATQLMMIEKLGKGKFRDKAEEE
jgi:flagellar assembly protein FliH